MHSHAAPQRIDNTVDERRCNDLVDGLEQPLRNDDKYHPGSGDRTPSCGNVT